MMDSAKKLYGIQKGRIPVLLIFLAIPGLFLTIGGAAVYLKKGNISTLPEGLFLLLITVLFWLNQKRTKIIT